MLTLCIAERVLLLAILCCFTSWNKAVYSIKISDPISLPHPNRCLNHLFGQRNILFNRANLLELRIIDFAFISYIKDKTPPFGISLAERKLYDLAYPGVISAPICVEPICMSALIFYNKLRIFHYNKNIFALRHSSSISFGQTLT